MTPKQFENLVIDLLSLQGWDVKTESLVGHKKVDCIASKIGEFGKQLNYLIECKLYENPLGKDDLVKIYADYLPLLKNNFANNILLITQNGITPASQAYISELTEFKHLSYKELINYTLNFDNYIDNIINSNIETSDVYIPQFSDGSNELLENLIINWSEDTIDYTPLAILGGYGMGKSTLSKRVSYLIAKSYKNNRLNRIPILITLDELLTESKLEGLLGSHFTTGNIIFGYNFNLFLRLNDLGRFVIILDGFDEMKKTMSWEALSYNLSQLNRLVVKNSKVILLGRPTAFLSDKEQKEAFQGIRFLKNQERKIPDWPEYREIYISPFSKNQIENFIEQYIEKIKSSKSKEYVNNLILCLNNIRSAEESRIIDIATRPVQMKMLMDIIPFYKGDVDKLTISVLYFEFIDLVIRREIRKISRFNFSLEKRKSFLRELAYWMYLNEHGSEIQINKIPDHLFSEYFNPESEDDFDAVKRDLLMGSILDRKPPTGFYFPHRSFQEYLISEYLVQNIEEKLYYIEDCPFLTLEIQSFFIELISRNNILKWKSYHEKENKINNDNTLSLLKFCLDYHKIEYDKTIYKLKTYKFFVSESELARKIQIVSDIIGHKNNSKFQIIKSKSINLNQTGKTKKHKYKK